MKVGFLGLGKLGLPVALAIESKGHYVCGTDISDQTIQNIKDKNLEEVKNFINSCEKIFENTKIDLEKKWINFKELFDKKNISRKECLLLPLRTVLKALQIQ